MFNKNVSLVLNQSSFLDIVFTLQKKIKELEERIEILEFEKTDTDFKLCRENCFSSVESLENTPKNAEYIHLDSLPL
jgi:hypothetical protein